MQYDMLYASYMCTVYMSFVLAAFNLCCLSCMMR